MILGVDRAVPQDVADSTIIPKLTSKIATTRGRPLDLRRAAPPDKTADPWYHTPEHRAWRAAVIGRAGGRCEWPGCDRAERRMFADHIGELKDGGAALDLRNGQCLCGAHHSLKTAQVRAARTA